MKVSYLLFNLMLLVGLMSSACGNIAQPQVKQTTISPLPTTTQKIVQQITSPIINRTSTPTVKKVKPTSTLLPASSPTSSPTLIVKPSLTPSPTFVSLSPLDETLQAVVFTTNGKQGPEIWRMQVNNKKREVKLLEQINLYTDFRTSIRSVFPSPDGQKIAISLGGEGNTTIKILNITTGQLTPLFNNPVNEGLGGLFLDWTPDSQNVLIMGRAGIPDFGNSAWLVDINSHIYQAVNIKRNKKYTPQIVSASFSPDGKQVVYTQFDCSHCDNTGNQVWQINLNTLDRQLLIEDTKKVIRDVLWSPHGVHIAFVQWEPTLIAPNQLIIGELYVMKNDGSEKHLISSLVTHYHSELFLPAWSPNKQQIAFVKQENDEGGKQFNKLFSNIYVANVLNNQVYQLTKFENTQVLKPTWSPDGTQLAFLAKENGRFKFYVTTVDGDELYQLEVNEALEEVQANKLSEQSSLLNLQSFIVWLP